MDQSAGKNLKEWIGKMDKNLQTVVLLAGPTGRTELMMFKVDIELTAVFPTIMDAIKHAEKNHRNYELGLVNGGIVDDNDDRSTTAEPIQPMTKL